MDYVLFILHPGHLGCAHLLAAGLVAAVDGMGWSRSVGTVGVCGAWLFDQAHQAQFYKRPVNFSRAHEKSETIKVFFALFKAQKNTASFKFLNIQVVI